MVSQIERRLDSPQDNSSGFSSASITLTVPVGGGLVSGTVPANSFGFLSKITFIVEVEVDRGLPITASVNEPSYGLSAGGTTLGITLSAASGTTLTANILAVGF